MADPAASTSSLLESLPALEQALDQLYARPWGETVEELGSLERAKMDILLSYAVNDLLWVYLKLKGVDPATHDVTAELERIKKYYAKIKAVEAPSERTRTVDKEAAHRFVSAAIPRAQRLPPTSAAAQAQAEREAHESANDRFSQRFKFVAGDDSTEKITPGQDADVAEGNEAEAEALMQEVDQQVKASPAEAEVAPTGPERKKRRKNRKN